MRIVIAALAVCLFAAGLPVSAGAPATTRTPIDIPAQELESALRLLAKERDLQVIYRSELVGRLRTAGATGNLTALEALNRLLNGTGLTFRHLNNQTVTIVPVDDRTATASEIGRAALSVGESKDGREISGPGVMRLARSDVDSPQAANDGIQGENTDTPAESFKGVPEMLVKGKRSSNIDIQRTADDVQPYVVFTAEDIERSMAGSLDRFLMQRLPMNASRYTAADIGGNSASTNDGNISSINLRGLGANQTLILVNGRRMPGVSTASSLAQSDINGIAMSSVARIEVLPSTAGGIYGGGATGGVINIILKNDYQGLEINARYDGTFRRDAAERLLEANAGFSLEGGRTSVMLSGSFKDSIPLLWGDRDFAVRGRQQLLENNPSVIYDDARPFGTTTNITSADGTPLVLASTGQSLGSTITYVPPGYAGPTNDGGAALAANAGHYNLDWPQGPKGLGQGITRDPEVTSMRLSVRRSFTDRIEAFIDGGWSRNDSTARDFSPILASEVYIEPFTPNNPFLQPITVQFPATDFKYVDFTHNASQVLNLAGGVIVRLPRNWTAQGEFGWGRSQRDFRTRPYANIYNAIADGSLKVLSDTSRYPLDYSPYLPPVDFDSSQPTPYGANLNNAALRLAGPTFHLPAGPIVLSALLERREDRVDGTIFESYSTFTGTFDYTYSPPRKQTTEDAYVELTTPLVSAANARPLLRALDLQTSYRFDRIEARTVATTSQGNLTLPSLDAPLPTPEYQSSHVSANQYTLGLRYQPLESLALRVSNAVGVLPPSLSQLVPNLRSNVNFGTSVRDPERKNDPVGVIPLVRSSGNPDLTPEHSDSWSAGAIFTPAFLPGFRFSVDYTRIEKTDEIASIPGFGQGLFNLIRTTFPERISRAPLTTADAASGYTVGRIASLDQSQINIAHTKVEAYDFQAAYRWTTAYGSLQFDAVATHETHFQKQLLSTSPVTEYIGFYDGPLEWRGNAGLIWERGPWALAWNMQYFDKIPVRTTSPSFFSDPAANQGAAFIPRQVYHDLSFKYRIDDAPLWGGALANTEILIGIANVLDTRPPIVTVDGFFAGLTGSPYQAPYGDPRLRRYSISVSKTFGH